MAENKKSFLLYSDLSLTVNKLPDETAGKLFKIILDYVNDKDPIVNDLLLEIAFEPIKQQLKRDLKNYEQKRGEFSEAGKISAKSRRLVSETQLYVIKLFNDTEEFIKVGITDFSISRRFSSGGDGMSNLGYKFEVLEQFFQKNLSIPVLDLEVKIREKYSSFSYSPINKFGGHTECYVKTVYNDLIKFSTSFNIVQYRPTVSTVNVNDTVNVNVTTLKEKRKTASPALFKIEKFKDVPHPNRTDALNNAWEILVNEPKWKKKTVAALTATLKKLEKFSEQDALQMVENAIAGGWQGVHPIDKNTKNEDNGMTNYLKNLVNGELS